MVRGGGLHGGDLVRLPDLLQADHVCVQTADGGRGGRRPLDRAGHEAHGEAGVVGDERDGLRIRVRVTGRRTAEEREGGEGDKGTHGASRAGVYAAR